MREITAIVVHGAWTRPTEDVGVKEIREWHKARGFNDVGYHFVIRRNGKIEQGRYVEVVGAHVQGHNENTIGICLVGGRDDMKLPGMGLPEQIKQEVLWEFNYTEPQIFSLIDLVTKLRSEHGVNDVLGHRDYKGVLKRCPGFDVQAFFGMKA